MKLLKFWNFRANAKILARQNKNLKQIQHIETSFDEQLFSKKQYNAAPKNVNEFMQKHKCNCEVPTINGILQCQYGCTCDHFRKTCSINCACEGMCIPNTFLHLPQLDIRLGIAGDELYTEEDIDSGCLAYVFTGKMNSFKHYLAKTKGKQPTLYTLIARWPGEDANGIGKPGVPTFVVDCYKEITGFINHSCDPNTEVFEIWQNGKLYIVGKTIKYCFKGDTITYDYNWEYTDDATYAEMCLCGSKNCQAFIAKIPLSVMQRSVPHYVGILNEMETHNILETQRLDRIITFLQEKKILTPQEKKEAENLKQDNEELRLTKHKAIFMKKGVFTAKAKLVELENEERYKILCEAKFSNIQVLPNDDNEDVNSPHRCVFSRASTPSSLASSSTKNIVKGETSTSMENPREHCVSKSRITRALQHFGLPFSVRIPLPIKDTDQCVLMGVEEIDKLLEESKILGEKSKQSCFVLRMPTNTTSSCLPSPRSPTKSIRSPSSATSLKSVKSFGSTSRLNQYDYAMNPSHIIDTTEKTQHGNPNTITFETGTTYKLTAQHKIQTPKDLDVVDATSNFAKITKVDKGKNKIETIYSSKNIAKNLEDWGEGLFTQDEMKRVFSWIDGTLHARSGSSQSQPWSQAKEWTYWLHKNFRHPTHGELENHTKTWVGISTKTLRACDFGKTPGSRTLPLARDVNTVLSDVLTFIPFRFSGFTLLESKKSGNIWRIVWSKANEPLPGNPTFRTIG